MKDTKEIMKQLQEGVAGVFESEDYKRYLEFMSKFHDYSANNIILIMLQNPEASLVAGYKQWSYKFNRHVRKGEKAITILAPLMHKELVEQEDGTTREETYVVGYRPVNVFDVSQTDGEEIPTNGCRELEGDVEEYRKLRDKLIDVSPVSIEFAKIYDGSLGFFSPAERRIVIKEGMSETQTIKTMVHEISHAILHNKQDGEQKDADRHTKEVQAESVAYSVCKMLGLDTDEYSFAYIAGWSKDKDTKELTKSLEIIRKTTNKILLGLDAA